MVFKKKGSLCYSSLNESSLSMEDLLLLLWRYCGLNDSSLSIGRVK